MEVLSIMGLGAVGLGFGYYSSDIIAILKPKFIQILLSLKILKENDTQ